MGMINRGDEWRKPAVAIGRELVASRRSRVVTDWILTEFLGLASRTPLRERAIRSVQDLREAPGVTIVEANHLDWLAGFELYMARMDKTWSLVDCISILICERYGITEVFSGDHHFEQAGLTLLKPAQE
jgi:predicted nucleic acid-binding protein